MNKLMSALFWIDWWAASRTPTQISTVPFVLVYTHMYVIHVSRTQFLTLHSAFLLVNRSADVLNPIMGIKLFDWPDDDWFVSLLSRIEMNSCMFFKLDYTRMRMCLRQGTNTHVFFACASTCMYMYLYIYIYIYIHMYICSKPLPFNVSVLIGMCTGETSIHTHACIFTASFGISTPVRGFAACTGKIAANKGMFMWESVCVCMLSCFYTKTSCVQWHSLLWYVYLHMKDVSFFLFFPVRDFKVRDFNVIPVHVPCCDVYIQSTYWGECGNFWFTCVHL